MTTFTLPRLEEKFTAVSESGFGALRCSVGNLPLARLAYETEVVGLLCRTTITQTYFNPFDECIEATYLFPIEGEQAVVRCELLVADRVIRAKLKERGEARTDYARAIRQGHRAALLEENRPETFSMKVGNIPPGEAVQIRIQTAGCLPVVEGEWTLRLPLVVAPRYTSGIALPRLGVGDGVALDTDVVPDASCVSPPTLLPGFASPVDLRISVSLKMGALMASREWPQRLASSLHTVMVTSNTEGTETIPDHCQLQILAGEKVDRDFILRGKLDETQILSSLDIESSRRADEPSIFALQVVPPRLDHAAPRDVVFLLDRSGSMEGWKLQAAARGVCRLIDSLSPADRFQAFAFDDRVDGIDGPVGTKSTAWCDATDQNRFKMTRWLSNIAVRGGTEMGIALERCLQFMAAHPRRRLGNAPPSPPTLVLITDGQITGEDALLQLLGTIPESQRPRIYCLGVDRAVNASVLQRLTKFTGGVFELVESEKRLDEVMQRFGREMGSPALTDVQVLASEGPANAMRLAPAAQRALYQGRLATFYGRIDPTRCREMTLRGTLASGEIWQRRFEISPDAATAKAEPLLFPLWGKARVRELEDAFIAGGNRDADLRTEITQTSIASGALSRFTAFVAVDETHRVTTGDAPHRIVQPVDYPEGWTMDSPLPIQRQHLLPLPRAIPTKSPVPTSSKHLPQPPAKPTSRTFSSLEELFVERGVVSREQLDEARTFSVSRGVSIADSLTSLDYASDVDLGKLSAEFHGAAFVERCDIAITEEVVAQLSEAVARENVVMPYALDGEDLVVLMSDPNDLDTIDMLRFILNRRVRPIVAPKSAILDAINQHYGQLEGESADSMIQEFTDTQIDFSRTAGEDEWEDFEEQEAAGAASALPESDEGVCYSLAPLSLPGAPLRARFKKRAPHVDPPGESAPIVRLVTQILREAIMLKASHVIFHLLSDKIQVTFVIDGKEQKHDAAPTRHWEEVIARLRKLGKMTPVARASYEMGNFDMTLWDTTFSIDVHFADLEPRVAPSVLIDMTRQSTGSHSYRVDSANQIEPVQAWLQTYLGSGVS